MALASPCPSLGPRVFICRVSGVLHGLRCRNRYDTQFLQGRDLAGALTSVTWFISQNRLPRRYWDHFTVGRLESADVAGTPRS